MQLATKQYIEAMELPIRNRGYIRVSIGVLNSDAQNNAEVDVSNTIVTYFSDTNKPFNGFKVNKPYATSEEDFSKVDGSMYFLPRENAGFNFYNNGIVTETLLGKIRIKFHGLIGLDIKGLTINFGEYYPTKFTIESDSGIHAYTNDKPLFITEDSFDGTSYFIISPSEMVNGHGRLRIYEMGFGITNTFSNDKVISCSMNEFVSPISESIPSMDVSLKIDNHDLYYSVDNPESAISYLEVGQKVNVSFGYDVTGKGDIEWLADTTTYLSSWSADDTEANFGATDRFYQLNEKYYKGLYRPSGISLYDLAVDVIRDAGITDEREFYIDTYLKKIKVYNPMPVVSHAEALQIIANAGRCVLKEDRNNKIHLKSSFVPDMTAASDDKTEFSKMGDLLKNTRKDAYSMTSMDFSKVDGSVFFLPKNENYLNTGYVSESVSKSDGVFEKNPKITIKLEASFDAFGMLINFRNTAPSEFKIKIYNDEVLVDEAMFKNEDVQFVTDYQFLDFNKMEIEITKGYPNSRVAIDNILIEDVTNYELKRGINLIGNQTGTRSKKIKNINIIRTLYRASQEGFKELLSETVSFSGTSDYVVYFSYPSYGFEVTVPDNPNVAVKIIDSSNYYLKMRFSNIQKKTELKFVVSGYEYVSDKTNYIVNHNPNGQEIAWENPLVSTSEHARDLEEWIAGYYLGYVDYDINWRGDPRVEANDLFYLELKNREKALIRSYQNGLEFNGAWSGTMKARKVVMAWQ